MWLRRDATPFNSLNSREIPSNRNIEIAGGSGTVGRSFISHTNRLETARRWNVPQVGLLYALFVSLHGAY